MVELQATAQTWAGDIHFDMLWRFSLLDVDGAEQLAAECGLRETLAYLAASHSLLWISGRWRLTPKAQSLEDWPGVSFMTMRRELRAGSP